MYCKKCFYNLTGTQEHICPECGRDFDQSNSSTYLASPGARFGKLNWMTAILASMPVVLVITVLLTWSLAWIALGHRPVPWIDDPKGIDSAIVQSSYFATMMLIMALPPALLLTIVMLMVSGFRCILDRQRLRGFLILLAYVVASVSLAYLLLTILPASIGKWLMD